jgi:hypothetical protein
MFRQVSCRLGIVLLKVIRLHCVPRAQANRDTTFKRIPELTLTKSCGAQPFKICNIVALLLLAVLAH